MTVGEGGQIWVMSLMNGPFIKTDIHSSKLSDSFVVFFDHKVKKNIIESTNIDSNEYNGVVTLSVVPNC